MVFSLSAEQPLQFTKRNPSCTFRRMNKQDYRYHCHEVKRRATLPGGKPACLHGSTLWEGLKIPLVPRCVFNTEIPMEF
jgi:hypothetical protein